jgi:recombinational DNA repair protein (RecF pathway)
MKPRSRMRLFYFPRSKHDRKNYYNISIMQEYVTDAIILRKDPLGDLDGRYMLFTKRFGKIVGKAKSSRRITSKLAPHLEPGIVAKVRFVEAKGTQIIDALKSQRLGVLLNDLHLLNQLLPDGEPEAELWEMLVGDRFAWPEVLAILGWDPENAQCAVCNARPPEYFYIPRQEFYCVRCASKVRRDAVISINARL